VTLKVAMASTQWRGSGRVETHCEVGGPRSALAFLLAAPSPRIHSTALSRRLPESCRPIASFIHQRVGGKSHQHLALSWGFDPILSTLNPATAGRIVKHVSSRLGQTHWMDCQRRISYLHLHPLAILGLWLPPFESCRIQNTAPATPTQTRLLSL
jgi:hypothetical protein